MAKVNDFARELSEKYGLSLGDASGLISRIRRQNEELAERISYSDIEIAFARYAAENEDKKEIAKYYGIDEEDLSVFLPIMAILGLRKFKDRKSTRLNSSHPSSSRMPSSA